MNKFARYADVIKVDYFTPGALFKIRFDPDLMMMQVLSTSEHLFQCMREAFSAENESAFFIKAHGYSIDSKVYLINKFGYFKPGLIFDILSYIKVNFGQTNVLMMSENCKDYITDYIIPFKKYIKNLNKDTFEIKNIADSSGVNNSRSDDKKLKLRYYQSEAIKRIIFEGYGRGLIELPTSAGKSFVIANLIHNIDRSIMAGLRYLIFVPNRQLVNQFYNDLLDYGFSDKIVTMFTSSKKGEPKYNPDAQIIITNRQYLFSNIDRLPKIDAIINDEVHQSKPDSQTLNVVDNMFDCKIKVGLSGTLPRHKYSKLSLVGSFGRIVYVETITDLQEQGYITKLKINVLSIKDKDIEKDRNCLFHEHSFVKFALDGSSGIDFNAAYDAEIDYINKNYVKLYSPILDILNNLEGNTLVLFDRIEFGQNMFSMTKESMFNKSVHYIDGQTPIIERENGRSMMETSNNNIMFGQCSILSTGINIKNLTNLVLMVSTKSFSRILQSIGRTLRLHQDKDYAQLYDISFNFKYSQKHFKERINIYKEMYHKKPDSIKVFEV